MKTKILLIKRPLHNIAYLLYGKSIKNYFNKNVNNNVKPTPITVFMKWVCIDLGNFIVGTNTFSVAVQNNVKNINSIFILKHCFKNFRWKLQTDSHLYSILKSSSLWSHNLQLKQYNLKDLFILEAFVLHNLTHFFISIYFSRDIEKLHRICV